MNYPNTISEYLRANAVELSDKVMAQFPPLYSPDDPIWPEIGQLKRKPFPAQTLAVMGTVKRLDEARAAAIVAECGTGKSLIGFASLWTHARGRKFTSLVMVPPSLTDSV